MNAAKTRRTTKMLRKIEQTGIKVMQTIERENIGVPKNAILIHPLVIAAAVAVGPVNQTLVTNIIV
jgi:hypothetical protein